MNPFSSHLPQRDSGYLEPQSNNFERHKSPSTSIPEPFRSTTAPFLFAEQPNPCDYVWHNTYTQSAPSILDLTGPTPVAWNHYNPNTPARSWSKANTETLEIGHQHLKRHELPPSDYSFSFHPVVEEFSSNVSAVGEISSCHDKENHSELVWDPISLVHPDY